MGHNQTPLEYDLNCTGHVWNMGIQQRSSEDRKKTTKKKTLSLADAILDKC